MVGLGGLSCWPLHQNLEDRYWREEEDMSTAGPEENSGAFSVTNLYLRKGPGVERYYMRHMWHETMHGKSLCLGIFIIHKNAFFLFSGKCHTIDVVFLHLVNQNLRENLPFGKKKGSILESKEQFQMNHCCSSGARSSGFFTWDFKWRLHIIVGV